MNKSLNGKIGLPSAVILCMNAMIGAGIFATPALLANSAGPAGIIAYFFVVIAVLFLALSLAQLAREYPEEGSFYLYAKQWSGRMGGLLASGSYILGISIALGALIQIASSYLTQLVPNLNQFYATASLIFGIYSLNIFGPKLVQAGQAFFISCTLFSILSTIVLCLLNAKTSNLTPFAPHGIAPIFRQISTAIFSFFGFESITALYKKVDNPGKNISKAVILSLSFVALLYLTFLGSILLAIPSKIFTTSTMPLSQAILEMYPKYSWLAKIIAISIFTALCGVLQSLLYAISNLAQTFVKNLNLNATNPIVRSKYSFEIILTLMTGFITLLSFSINKIGIFFNLASIFVILAFILSIITLVVKDKGSAKSKIVPILGLITGSLILLNAIYSFLLEIM